MSIGSSGRIVVEIDPDLKKDLYSALVKEGLSLKEWFLRGATSYLEHSSQLQLDLPERETEDQLPIQDVKKNRSQ
ncbi:hypothetical protein ACMHYJ_13115 [Castellaniella hirudinis]|uniref:hypothetical protein n=1 Tax=Castellaniella hirudinis TaxID=1144617 RepID=UPI0039C38119